MEVILYQIGIFLAIQLAAKFGRNSRNTSIILISIFTVLQVYASWLFTLQFTTILVSYLISNSILSEIENNKNLKELNIQEKESYLINKFDIKNYGTVQSNPILMNSISSSYAYLNKLKSIKYGTEFSRKGSITTNIFPHPIDIYEFKISGNYFCTIYIYPYSNRNIEEIPVPFINLTNLLKH